MDKKRRIKYIDLCKGLGILMVTWGHITKLDNPVDTWGHHSRWQFSLLPPDI